MNANKHALLSASSSHRWIHCPPSARLSAGYADSGSSFAAEGTDAHKLCEYKLKCALGMKAKDPTKELTYRNDEMDECTDGYTAFILECFENAKQQCRDPIVLIEQRLDLSSYIKDGFGTGDCLIIADGTLHIIDYKHGQGVLVEANNNPQMMIYALGALDLFDAIYDIENVSMTIYQPRRENISTQTMLKTTLYNWADETLQPAAELAYGGLGDYKSGDWCVFCKAKHECRKRAEDNLAIAKHSFKRPPVLDDSEVEGLLGKLNALESWVNDIKNYALQSAISGKLWAGYKLVEGKSTRKYTSEEEIAKSVSAAGYSPYENKIMGLTALEKTLGKTKFNEICGHLIERRKGKPTLVPNNDKRPAINAAAHDFLD